MVGVINESFQKHREIGAGQRYKLFVGGEAREGVTTAGLPQKILIIHKLYLGGMARNIFRAELFS